jgi:sugar-specific transcriptional regulator TrmB
MGLFPAEAQIYLSLLRNGGPMRASAIVAASGVPRGSIYAALTRLSEIGLVEAEAGYGSRFSPVPADKAMSLLIARSRDELSQREEIGNELARDLRLSAEGNGLNGASELVQVLRDPRAVRERVERLQLEARRQIDVFTKPPYFGRGNPTEQKTLRRGLRVRSLYERAALEDPRVKPYFAEWIVAGEEARVVDDELPHKLAIFDNEIVVLPLPVAGDQMRTVLIRHRQLAKSLGLAFQFLWDRAAPLITRDRTIVAAAERSKRGEGGRRKQKRVTQKEKK